MPEFDVSELLQFTHELGEVPRQAIPNVRKAVEFSARTTKDAWRETARPLSGGHARAYPFSIDYDMKLDTDGEISAEIGPNLGKSQGTLGILEDAPGGVRSTPQRAGQKAAAIGAKDLEAGLAKALEDVL